MRCLILSDLHSNWPALEAVLGAAKNEYDKIVCCGDLVGYGPDPGLIVDWAREHVDVVVRGNHDRACCGLEDLEWFNPVAKAASLWTTSHMTENDLQWLRELPRGPLMVEGFSIAHGSPLDEDEYVMSLADASNVIDYVEAAVTFFGHTHVQGCFSWVEKLPRKLAGPQRLLLDPSGVYMINPGSVGQPRDRDPRAAYCLFDTTTREVRLMRVAYDHEAVRQRIEMVGLPPVLGLRLGEGR